MKVNDDKNKEIINNKTGNNNNNRTNNNKNKNKSKNDDNKIKKGFVKRKSKTNK